MSLSRASQETRIAVIGPGLLGGSIALAVRERMPGTELRLWARREAAVEQLCALHLGHIATTDLSEAVEGATLVILATPIDVMPELARQMASAQLSPNTLVTDVGSVKASVVRALTPLFHTTSATFIGSHPMAGSEKAGLEAAHADLFDGAACILTPLADTIVASTHRLHDFWTCLGCRCLQLSPEQHDRQVARVSHLPHFLAAVATRAALDADPSARQCIGPGFRDTTRVASGDPQLWTGIASQNRSELVAALEDAHSQLSHLLEILRASDDVSLHHFLAQAKALRDAS